MAVFSLQISQFKDSPVVAVTQEFFVNSHIIMMQYNKLGLIFSQLVNIFNVFLILILEIFRQLLSFIYSHLNFKNLKSKSQ